MILDEDGHRFGNAIDHLFRSLTLEMRDRSVGIVLSGTGTDGSVMHGDAGRRIDLGVTPVGPVHTKERFYLVLFTPGDPGAPAVEPEPPSKTKKSVYLAQIEQLRQDLQATRTSLQATIEKHEATNQELRAANEEIQSSNEELQSTNEELTTVNEELHSRQFELIQANRCGSSGLHPPSGIFGSH